MKSLFIVCQNDFGKSIPIIDLASIKTSGINFFRFYNERLNFFC